MQERSYDAAQPPEPQPVPVKRKRGRGKIAFIVAAFIVVVAIAASAGNHSGGAKAASQAAQADNAPQAGNQVPVAPAVAKTTAAPVVPPTTTPPQMVTYTVTGSAPDGVDITWGTDSSNHEAHSLPFTETVPLADSGVLYYAVTAQLQGSGDISCQISVGGKVLKSGSASGDYNICSSQIGQNPLSGEWEGE